MKVFVLSSSRADYSIFYPLLKALHADKEFELKVIAFGTHLSEKFGRTEKIIEKDGFDISHRIETLPLGDSPLDISAAIGTTIKLFAPVWKEIADSGALVIALGDRYEMFAAVMASVPFSIKVAHIHGGEETLGAIDNIFRHSITHAARIHFASTPKSAQRISQIKGSSEGVHKVGSLSIDSLQTMKLLNDVEFEQRFGIAIRNPVLVTFHPETVEYNRNSFFVDELIAALSDMEQQIIITMPNADTMGTLVRDRFISFAKDRENVKVVESFGREGYFSCLSLCDFVLGNSSSGIIEAASFRKYVINIGDRQKGREAGANVIHCEISHKRIIEACLSIRNLPSLLPDNIYYSGGAATKITDILKQYFRTKSMK
ncbi:MAG: UDP-N-acetylglucosamine 2-epimerase (hydrolyzing) [Parachlamydiaceae bacterium]|nr:UDP-N-acetylglucosamine 2-epimerase (hydrolyzing) [Parachlamydiaceae bacterium]